MPRVIDNPPAHRLRKTRVEHLLFTIDGNPDREVLKQEYRVVIFYVDLRGSKPQNIIEWVGQCRNTKLDIAKLQKTATREGARFDHTTQSVNIYTSISAR